MKWISVIIGIIIFVALGSMYIYRTSPTSMQGDSQSLTVGIAAGYAPYISINGQGDYEGFDIDVAQALAAKLNKKLILKDVGSMAPLMIALDQGSVDIAMWGLTITKDRLHKLAMVHYQGAEKKSNPMVFWQNIPNNIQTLDDMKGMTVCIEPTSFQSDVIARYPDIRLLPTEKVDDALLNIRYGKADAAFIDPEIAKKFKAKYPEIQIMDMPLADDEQALGIGIAIKQDNGAMIKKITGAIELLKAEGTMNMLEKKWSMQ